MNEQTRWEEAKDLDVRAADGVEVTLDVFHHPYAYAAARRHELLAAA